jgi:hypothetical protein
MMFPLRIASLRYGEIGQYQFVPGLWLLSEARGDCPRPPNGDARHGPVPEQHKGPIFEWPAAWPHQDHQRHRDQDHARSQEANSHW